MAFPTTGIIDTFDRANSNISGSTSSSGAVYGTSDVYGFGNQLKVLSNQCVEITSGAQSGDYIASVDYGPDCEMYLTGAVIPGAWNLGCYLRLTGSPGSMNGYSVGADNTPRLIFNRVDGGVETQLGATETVSLASGDAMGASVIGGGASMVFTAYTKPSAGAWGTVNTRADATYSAAGKLGIETAFVTIDDFGGGNSVIGPPTATPTITVTHNARW